MMSDENLTAGQRKLLQMLTDSAHKMLGLINLSSTLYQIEQGVYEPAWGAFDLLQLLKRCMADNRSLSRAKSIDLHLLTAGFEPPDPEKVIVHGEELLTYSIFSNLVVNAVEASPEGNRVAVRIQRGRGIRVEIHNQGAVPATVRQRFFDKYVTFGKEKGTGLGTYSAKLLAEVQGWSISMVTSREEGTVVRVAIPV
jgi:signal transduction histidine kinase